MKTNQELFSFVIQVLDDIVDVLRTHTAWHEGPLEENQLNERYVHHILTHRLQEEHCSIIPIKGKVRLFPEWPSWKKDHVGHRKYKYYPKESRLNGEIHEGFYPITDAEINIDPKMGSAGFFDLCIGNEYEKPTIGIELILKRGWSKEEFTFDFMKILDNALPFAFRLAYGIILRPNGLPQKSGKKELEKAVNNAFVEAEKRLGNDSTKTQDYKLIVVEVAEEGIRRWVRVPGASPFNEEKNLAPLN